MAKQLYIDFDEYIRQGEPEAAISAEQWKTAIGLQAVDGMTPSQYLIDVARRNIEGDITMDEVQDLLHSYYASAANRDKIEENDEEADKTSANIKRILSTNTLAFNTNGYIATHRRIFEGVFKHAGQLRKYDISKKEWVLNGETVNYLNWEDLRRALDYDIQQEKDFSYKGLSDDEKIKHLCRFTSGLWQIHPFCEGNTRTTAVFLIQYMRSIGYKVTNDMFAEHSWYFRNALVRANYKNSALGIDYDQVFLERFLRNMLLGEQWVLKNRYLVINPPQEFKVQPRLDIVETEQVSNKYRTSTEQVPNKLVCNDPNIVKLIKIIGYKECSIKQMMDELSLKHRPNFLNLYLSPALAEGYVSMLYPDSPRHPRQCYLLTAKGQMLYKEL
ncbi:MAG: Fic family protein [Bacteroidales bacterium]|nr:Fic family protein [Bacteroidales bacterium]